MAIGLKPFGIVQTGKYPLLQVHKSWARIELSRIAEVLNGFAFQSSQFNSIGKGVPIIRIRDVGKENSETYYEGRYDVRYLIEKGDILIGMDGDFRCDKWKGIPSLLNQRVCKIIPSTKDYSIDFLVYVLQPYLNAINAETSSVTVKHLSSNTVKEIPLPLPPLPEQHRIVAKLEELFSELDNGIAHLKKAQAQLKVYRQAVLKAAFEGKLTEKWRDQQRAAGNLPSADALLEQIQEERQRHSRKPKEYPPLTEAEVRELPGLPEGWKWARLGNFSSGVEYGSSQKSSEFGRVPVIRMGNLQSGKIDWNDLVFTSDPEEIAKYSLTKGDVLFNRTNSPELVGKTAIFMGERPAIFAGYLIRINHLVKIMDSKFLNFYLNSYIAKNQGNRVKTDGVNQSNINGQKLSNYPVPLVWLVEQLQIAQEIESRLSVCDHLEQEIDKALQQSEALRQSILKKAFEGRLVPQDPEDEPAGELLKRIMESND